MAVFDGSNLGFLGCKLDGQAFLCGSFDVTLVVAEVIDGVASGHRPTPVEQSIQTGTTLQGHMGTHGDTRAAGEETPKGPQVVQLWVGVI